MSTDDRDRRVRGKRRRLTRVRDGCPDLIVPRTVYTRGMVRNGTVARVDDLVDDPVCHPALASFGGDGEEEAEFAVR